MLRAAEQRRSRNLEEERRHFAHAASLAKSERDKVEALYRKAHSELRSGNSAEAAQQLRSLAESFPDSPRSARAWLDLGRLYEKEGDIIASKEAYHRLLEGYPDSGNALTGARRLVALSKAKLESSQLWKQLLEEHQGSSLEEGLRYEFAKSLEETNPRSAIEEYQRLARLFPLPKGTFTDDGLLRAARLRRRLGDFQGALETLDVLLARKEKAWLIGSYARASYLEGWWLKAAILRVNLHDCRAAAEVFLELTERFPTDTSADNALLLRADCLAGAGVDPCPTVELLQERFPQSNLLPCARKLCPNKDGRKKEQPTPGRCQRAVSEVGISRQ